MNERKVTIEDMQCLITEIKYSIQRVEFMRSHFTSGEECAAGIAIQCYFWNLVADVKMTPDQQRRLLELSPVRVVSTWTRPVVLSDEAMMIDGWCALHCACPSVIPYGSHYNLFEHMDMLGLTPFGALLMAIEVYLGRVRASVVLPFLLKDKQQYACLISFVTSIGIAFGHVRIPVPPSTTLMSLKDLAAAKAMFVVGQSESQYPNHEGLHVLSSEYGSIVCERCENCQSYCIKHHNVIIKDKQRIIQQRKKDKDLSNMFNPIESHMIKVCGFC